MATLHNAGHRGPVRPLGTHARRKMVPVFVSLIIAAALLLPRGAEGQAGIGFRGWAGAGYGSFGCWESFRCDFNEFNEVRGAWNGFLGGSAELSRFFEAGAEFTSRRKDRGPSTISLRTTSALLLFRMPAVSGLRLRASLGQGVRKVVGTEGDIILDERASGAYRSAGISHDWRVSPRLSLSPALEVGAIDFGDEKDSKMWEVRLGLTWR